MPPLNVTQPDPIRVERRASHRFTQYQIAVQLRALDGTMGAGFTLDLSCRGALVRTDFPVSLGQMLEMSLVMPSEITLAEDMSVRCRARVLRLEHDQDAGKAAVAVKIEHYEFLPRQMAPEVRAVQENHPVRP
ncbi:MAG: PilZ domain-containing protein [Acidobacteria bacterium]|nr:PilZ domain-containing protein [Acidobacteriota bacterium]